MPEISESDYRQFVAYQGLGTIGEIQKKIGDLEKDNGKQRDRMKELEAAQLKPDQVAVPKADAEALEKYRALGKPDELKATVEKVPTLEQEIATRDKRERLTKAARLLSADEGAATHLQKYLPDLADRLEFREVTEGDQKAEAAFYKPEQGDSRPLAKYLEEEHPLVWKGLQQGGGESPRKPERGQPFAGRQSGGEKKPEKAENPAEAAIQRNRERAGAPNALRPAKA